MMKRIIVTILAAGVIGTLFGLVSGYVIHFIGRYVKKRKFVRKHGTPPGTYEVNMEDWD